MFSVPFSTLIFVTHAFFLASAFRTIRHHDVLLACTREWNTRTDAKDFLCLCFARQPEDRPNALTLSRHKFIIAEVPATSISPASNSEPAAASAAVNSKHSHDESANTNLNLKLNIATENKELDSAKHHFTGSVPSTLFRFSQKRTLCDPISPRTFTNPPHRRLHVSSSKGTKMSTAGGHRYSRMCTNNAKKYAESRSLIFQGELGWRVCMHFEARIDLQANWSYLHSLFRISYP